MTEGFHFLFYELCAIIRSKDFYVFLKLGLNKGMEMAEMFENLTFLFHKVDPGHTSTIINKKKKVLSPPSPPTGEGPHTS